MTTHPHGVPDMAKLDHLHEASLLHNLVRRHAAALPYTATGPIVLAVNPYRWLDGLYGEAEAGRCVLFGVLGWKIGMGPIRSDSSSSSPTAPLNYPRTYTTYLCIGT